MTTKLKITKNSNWKQVPKRNTLFKIPTITIVPKKNIIYINYICVQKYLAKNSHVTILFNKKEKKLAILPAFKITETSFKLHTYTNRKVRTIFCTLMENNKAIFKENKKFKAEWDSSSKAIIVDLKKPII